MKTYHLSNKIEEIALIDIEKLENENKKKEHGNLHDNISDFNPKSSFPTETKRVNMGLMAGFIIGAISLISILIVYIQLTISETAVRKMQFNDAKKQEIQAAAKKAQLETRKLEIKAWLTQ